MTTSANETGLIAVSGRANRKQELVDFLDGLVLAYGDDARFCAHHAMALSENGQIAVDRLKIERAIASTGRPNASAAHAMAHVVYESAEAGASIAFLRSWLIDDPPIGAFRGHLSWHLALIRMSTGDREAAGRLFDEVFAADDYKGRSSSNCGMPRPAFGVPASPTIIEAAFKLDKRPFIASCFGRRNIDFCRMTTRLGTLDRVASRRFIVFALGAILRASSWVSMSAEAQAPKEREAVRLMDDLMWGRGTVGGSFELKDQNGRKRNDVEFRGKILIVYFGYTYCPDVCPTDLQEIELAVDRLGDAVRRSNHCLFRLIRSETHQTFWPVMSRPFIRG